MAKSVRTVKQAILDYLKEHPFATSKELNDAIDDYTRVQISTSLANMVFTGVLEIKKARRGKPLNIYRYIRDIADRDLDIVEQCKINWAGYEIHKIFGMTNRNRQSAPQ